MTEWTRLPRPQLRSSDPQLVDELQQHTNRGEQAESVIKRRNDKLDFSSGFPAEVDPREPQVLGRVRYVQEVQMIIAETPILEQFQELRDDIEPVRITASDPMPVLRLLLEVFCRILDRPASYERARQTLLMDRISFKLLLLVCQRRRCLLNCFKQPPRISKTRD
jgi:hypothetical protein